MTRPIHPPKEEGLVEETCSALMVAILSEETEPGAFGRILREFGMKLVEASLPEKFDMNTCGKSESAFYCCERHVSERNFCSVVLSNARALLNLKKDV